MRSFAVIDLAYGDAGKGTIVDFLTREYDAKLVVRFNGGSQASHNVVTPEGHHHPFSQFGSGTLAGALTYLSEHMMVNPLSMLNEADALAKPPHNVWGALNRMIVHADAPVTTPFHVSANRLRETGRGESRHGSCGHGIGETMMDVLDDGIRHLTVSDLRKGTLLKRLIEIRERKLEEMLSLNLYEWDPTWTLDNALRIANYYELWANEVVIVDSMPRSDVVIFEGAQGVLLDQDYGFDPYTTWSKTTTANVDSIVSNEGLDTPHVIGVTRSFMTRHGPGPFVTEADVGHLEGEHNRHHPWQGKFRSGHADFVALDYAIEACAEDGMGIDGLAVTWLDHPWSGSVALDYRLRDVDYRPVMPSNRNEQRALTNDLFACEPVYWIEPNADVADLFGGELGVPVEIESHGPTALDKNCIRDRRAPRNLWSTAEDQDR